jgi:hypothetical protein
VFALLPNHYLDLPTMQPLRYYLGPADYGRLSSKTTAPKAAEIIVSTLKAMSHRHKLAYAATGGHDSRVLAGALGRAGLAKEVDCFTFKYPFDPSGVHNDIVLARRVAAAVDCPHRIIDARSDDPDPAVSERCRQSEEMIATGFEGWAERVATEVADNRLILMGWASEIARCYYRWPGSDKVTARQLADCAGVGRIGAFLPEFERWLAEAEDVHRKSGLPILDLFYWENRVGRWCGAGLNVLNCGADWVTLYSCRDLLDTLLMVREVDRSGADQKLYREIVRHLNPAIARIPINPMPLQKRTRKAVTLLAKRVVRRLRPKPR